MQSIFVRTLNISITFTGSELIALAKKLGFTAQPMFANEHAYYVLHMEGYYLVAAIEPVRDLFLLPQLDLDRPHLSPVMWVHPDVNYSHVSIIHYPHIGINTTLYNIVEQLQFELNKAGL